MFKIIKSIDIRSFFFYKKKKKKETDNLFNHFKQVM